MKQLINLLLFILSAPFVFGQDDTQSNLLLNENNITPVEFGQVRGIKSLSETWFNSTTNNWSQTFNLSKMIGNSSSIYHHYATNSSATGIGLSGYTDEDHKELAFALNNSRQDWKRLNSIKYGISSGIRHASTHKASYIPIKLGLKYIRLDRLSIGLSGNYYIKGQRTIPDLTALNQVFITSYYKIQISPKNNLYPSIIQASSADQSITHFGLKYSFNYHHFIGVKYLSSNRWQFNAGSTFAHRFSIWYMAEHFNSLLSHRIIMSYHFATRFVPIAPSDHSGKMKRHKKHHW